MQKFTTDTRRLITYTKMADEEIIVDAAHIQDILDHHLPNEFNDVPNVCINIEHVDTIHGHKDKLTQPYTFKQWRDLIWYILNDWKTVHEILLRTKSFDELSKALTKDFLSKLRNAIGWDVIWEKKSEVRFVHMYVMHHFVIF